MVYIFKKFNCFYGWIGVRCTPRDRVKFHCTPRDRVKFQGVSLSLDWCLCSVYALIEAVQERKWKSPVEAAHSICRDSTSTSVTKRRPAVIIQCAPPFLLFWSTPQKCPPDHSSEWTIHGTLNYSSSFFFFTRPNGLHVRGQFIMCKG